MYPSLTWLCLALATPAANVPAPAPAPALAAPAPAPTATATATTPVDPASRLTVLIDPADAVAAGARVSFKKLSPGASALPCPLDSAGACEARIEPGEWEVTVEAPGYQTHVERLMSGAQPSVSLGVALTPVPAPAPAATTTESAAPAPALPPERIPKKTRLRHSAGLILPGVPIFMAGLAVAIYGTNVYDRTKRNAHMNGELLPAISLRAAGIGMMGAAVGLFATGLTAEYDVKRWLWLTELGIGVAAIAGGSTWMVVSTQRWNHNQLQQMVCNNNTGVDCFDAHRLGAGFVLGLGSGLVFGATTGLIVRAVHGGKPPRVSVTPSFGASQGGLLLQGRF